MYYRMRIEKIILAMCINSSSSISILQRFLLVFNDVHLSVHLLLNYSAPRVPIPFPSIIFILMLFHFLLLLLHISTHTHTLIYIYIYIHIFIHSIF